MTTLGLVRQATKSSKPLLDGAEGLRLRVEDALASSGRIWVRGRLVGGPLPLVYTRARQGWWRRWWRNPASALLPAVRLETRIGGHLFETELPLGPDGRFEATFRADLPAARRGWRIARNRVTWQGKTAEQCGVVITLPDNACAVAVVILPLESTARADGAQRLARSVQAVRLTPVLRCLHQTPGEVHAVYYLGCTSGPGDSQQAELALATTTLGWPPGSFLLLPLVQDAPDVIVAGLDRLRWLFAGEMDLRVLNLEPAFTAALTASVAPKEDRAMVRRLSRTR